MTAKEDFIALAQDWKTIREIADASGRKVRTAETECRSLWEMGLLERRFADGRGTEYRAVPGARFVSPMWGPRLGALEALRDGPKTARDIAGPEADRKELSRVGGILARAEKRGLAERVPGTYPIVWRLAP